MVEPTGCANVRPAGSTHATIQNIIPAARVASRWHRPSFSRRLSPGLCCLLCPHRKWRAQGRPGARMHPRALALGIPLLGRTMLNVPSVKIKLRASWTNRRRSKQQASIFAVGAPHRPQEEDSAVRGIAIVLAITGSLAVSGIAAPAPAHAGRLASTPYGCHPSHGPHPGYAQPYAYAAYYYGYPPDCGGTSIYFYFAPAYYGYRYGDPRYWHRGWHRHW